MPPEYLSQEPSVNRVLALTNSMRNEYKKCATIFIQLIICTVSYSYCKNQFGTCHHFADILPIKFIVFFVNSDKSLSDNKSVCDVLVSGIA